MACPANSRETKIALGFVAQDDLITPNTGSEIFSMTITNPAPFVTTPTTETDAEDIGKGDEFPTQMFPVSMDVTGHIEKFLSSQAAAWAFAFGLGDVTASGTAPNVTYTCIPTDPATACIDLAPFTAVEQIRPGAGAFTDNAYVGCVVTGFTISLESGPGRSNARLTIDVASTGRIESPSGLTIPAPIHEEFLNAASAAISVNGINYISTRSFISCEISWNVNPRLDTGYYPGSGVDENGFAMRGRMEYSTRQAQMTFVARAQQGSPEYNMLLNMTEGVTTVQLTGAEGGGILITFPRSVITAAVNGDADGLVTISGTVTPLKPPTGPYVTFAATTNFTPGTIDPEVPVTPLAEAA